MAASQLYIASNKILEVSKASLGMRLARLRMKPILLVHKLLLEVRMF